jgi:hypothetical protein
MAHQLSYGRWSCHRYNFCVTEGRRLRNPTPPASLLLCAVTTFSKWVGWPAAGRMYRVRSIHQEHIVQVAMTTRAYDEFALWPVSPAPTSYLRLSGDGNIFPVYPGEALTIFK